MSHITFLHRWLAGFFSVADTEVWMEEVFFLQTREWRFYGRTIFKIITLFEELSCVCWRLWWVGGEVDKLIDHRPSPPLYCFDEFLSMCYRLISQICHHGFQIKQEYLGLAKNIPKSSEEKSSIKPNSVFKISVIKQNKTTRNCHPKQMDNSSGLIRK